MRSGSRFQRDELAVLVDAWYAGDLDGQEAKCLVNLLEEDPRARQLFVEYGSMLAALEFDAIVDPEPSIDSVLTRTLSAKQVDTGSRRWLALGGACALVSIAIFVTAAYHAFYWLNDKPVAVVTDIHSSLGDAAADDLKADLVNRNGVAVGNEIRWRQELSLEGAQDVFVTFRFETGAELTVQGGTTLRFDHNSVEMDGGRLLGSIPPAATGFTVRTPHGWVRDLGTEFAVHAEEQATHVSVLNGVVDCELISTSGDPKVARLVGGESAKLSPSNNTLATFSAPQESLKALLDHHSGIVGGTGRVKFLSGPPSLPTEKDAFVPDAVGGLPGTSRGPDRLVRPELGSLRPLLSRRQGGGRPVPTGRRLRPVPRRFPANADR